MKFEEAVNEMDKREICKSSTGLLYRIKNFTLEFKNHEGEWEESKTSLITHFKSRWLIVEEKKTLSDKIKPENFGMMYTTNRAVLHIEDVKEAIKEIKEGIKEIKEGTSVDEVYSIIDKVVGEGLI